MPTVAYAATFDRDLGSQTAYLAEHQQADWARRLKDDLDRLEQLLAHFPWSGRELARTGEVSVRKLKLRQTPFIVWYAVDKAADRVVFFRLFHARQRMPEPRLP